MTARHSALIITTIALILLALVPAVSAEILEDTEYSDYFAKVATVTRTAGTSSQAIPNGIIMSTPLSVPEFEHMFAQMKSSIVSNYASIPSSGQANVEWYIVDDNGITGAFYMSGTYGYFKYTAGGGNWLQIWAEFNDPAVTLTGPTYLKCVLQEGESIVWPMVSLRTYKSNENAAQVYNNLVTDTPGIKATFGNIIGTSAVFTLADANNVKTYPVVSGTWKNGLRIETIGGGVPRAQIDIIKEYDGYFGVSDHYVTFGETVYSDLGGASDIQYIIPESEYPFSVSIYNAQNNKWYNSTYGEASPDDPDDPGDPSRVMVHIIAQDARNENLLLDAAVEVRDQYDAVVAAGTTSPEGWMVFEYDLPDTLTDEDFDRYYTVSVSLPGWTQKVTNFKFYPAFIPRSGDWIRVEMLPDTDGPADPEKTYIMFFVRDIHSNPLERASIEIAGQYWHTNSAGHVAVEVPKNSTTAYTVRKTGHVSISGSAAVGAEGSYVVNIALGPALPDRTPGPGDDPGATPPPRDTRTNEEKGKAVIDLIADNAELIATLAILAAVMGLINLIMPGRRRR